MCPNFFNLCCVCSYKSISQLDDVRLARKFTNSRDRHVYILMQHT